MAETLNRSYRLSNGQSAAGPSQSVVFCLSDGVPDGRGIFQLRLPVSMPVFMPPTSKKLRGHIGLGLSVRLSVCLSVRLSVRNTFWKLRNSRTPYARILKFYIWHIHEK